MSTVTDEEQETAPYVPDEAASPRRGYLVLGLIALIVVLAGLTGWQGYEAVQRSRAEAATADAVRAARLTVQNFVSISAATIDRDLKRVSDGATGDFADEFERGKAQVKTVVVANKVRSTGTILEAAVDTSDKDSARILVVVDATVINVNAPKGQLRHYRISVDLAKVKDDWRVSTLKFVG
jgi:Mce-associated membrane protein